MDLICPKCQGAMRQYERNGVTVDQCGECRGIFLDRGELERLVDAEQQWNQAQSAAPMQQPYPGQVPPSPYPPQAPYPQEHSRGYHHDHDDDDDDYRYGRKRHKRRESFLENLFD